MPPTPTAQAFLKRDLKAVLLEGIHSSAIDALRRGRVVVTDMQRLVVAQHALQVAVGADGRAEAQAQGLAFRALRAAFTQLRGVALQRG